MDEEGRAWVLPGSLRDSLHPHLLRQDGAARRRMVRRVATTRHRHVAS